MLHSNYCYCKEDQEMYAWRQGVSCNVQRLPNQGNWGVKRRGRIPEHWKHRTQADARFWAGGRGLKCGYLSLIAKILRLSLLHSQTSVQGLSAKCSDLLRPVQRSRSSRALSWASRALVSKWVLKVATERSVPGDAIAFWQRGRDLGDCSQNEENT